MTPRMQILHPMFSDRNTPSVMNEVFKLVTGEPESEIRKNCTPTHSYHNWCSRVWLRLDRAAMHPTYPPADQSPFLPFDSHRADRIGGGRQPPQRPTGTLFEIALNPDQPGWLPWKKVDSKVLQGISQPMPGSLQIRFLCRSSVKWNRADILDADGQPIWRRSPGRLRLPHALCSPGATPTRVGASIPATDSTTCTWALCRKK
jgi:hypothetical protein